MREGGWSDEISYFSPHSPCLTSHHTPPPLPLITLPTPHLPHCPPPPPPLFLTTLPPSLISYPPTLPYFLPPPPPLVLTTPPPPLVLLPPSLLITPSPLPHFSSLPPPSLTTHHSPCNFQCSKLHVCVVTFNKCISTLCLSNSTTYKKF